MIFASLGIAQASLTLPRTLEPSVPTLGLSKTFGSQLSTLNSQFSILNSSFLIPHSPITPFSRDFCFARHSTSKLDSALAYRKNSQLLLSVVIFASLSIAQASLTLPSLVAKILNSQLSTFNFQLSEG